MGRAVDPLANATKAERRAWSKKNQAKAMRAWSSTNVRYLLAHGRIQDANAILGAPHSIEGEVVHGEERGRTIVPHRQSWLRHCRLHSGVDGVYAGWLVDGENRWPAAISIGTKPTFSEKTGLNERVVEAYCITEEWIDLYDHKVRVEFVGFLRPQVKFDGPDQLVDELKRNVEETKRLTA